MGDICGMAGTVGSARRQRRFPGDSAGAECYFIRIDGCIRSGHQKATVPPIGLIATSSPGEANPTGPIHSLNAEDLTAGRPVLGIPELRVLDFADPLLLVVNLTRPVRALGTALESTLSD
jgi:hypothetical protein